MKDIHIILADDDFDDQFFFKRALKEINITARLTIVNDGEKLMEYLENNAAERPDVIFLDLNMPRKTGHVCLTEIKGEKKFKDIPVVIYSTSYMPDVADLLYRVGANYYLQKCDFDEMTKKIAAVLILLENNPAQPSRNKFVLNRGIFI